MKHYLALLTVLSVTLSGCAGGIKSVVNEHLSDQEPILITIPKIAVHNNNPIGSISFNKKEYLPLGNKPAFETHERFHRAQTFKQKDAGLFIRKCNGELTPVGKSNLTTFSCIAYALTTSPQDAGENVEIRLTPTLKRTLIGESVYGKEFEMPSFSRDELTAYLDDSLTISVKVELPSRYQPSLAYKRLSEDKLFAIHSDVNSKTLSGTLNLRTRIYKQKASGKYEIHPHEGGSLVLVTLRLQAAEGNRSALPEYTSTVINQLRSTLM